MFRFLRYGVNEEDTMNKITGIIYFIDQRKNGNSFWQIYKFLNKTLVWTLESKKFWIWSLYACLSASNLL